MDPRLLQYYNLELQHLREMGAEFAQQFPKVASRLGMNGLEVADPYVERLLEGVGFLAARVQLKLDAEFPRFTQSLLEIIYPHYLAPTPSMLIARMQPDSTDPGLVTGPIVRRGSAMHATGAGAGTPCEFRTAHDVRLWPIDVAAASYFSFAPDLPLNSVPVAQRIKGGVRLRLNTMGGVKFSQLPIDRLCFHLAGRDDVANRLYELCLSHRLGVVVLPSAAGSRGEYLPAESTEHVGFSDDEALLPVTLRSFQGYRLLQEYFSFAPRFRFVQIKGLGSALQKIDATAVDIVLLMGRGDATLETLVDRSNFALFCTPAINLFPKQADRIPISDSHHEFHVVPDRTRPLDFEVYEVDGVVGHGAGRDSEQRFLPLYSAASNDAGGQHGAHFTTRREPRLIPAAHARRGERSSYVGSEVFLSLVDPSQAPYRSDLRQLSVHTLCTNRDLPLKIGPGGRRGDLMLDVAAPVSAIDIVGTPSRPYGRLAEGSIAWNAISHLSLNYLSLVDASPAEGATALRELLGLYAGRHDAAARRQIESLRSVQARRVVRRLPRSKGPLAFGRGLEISVVIDELGFEGGSGFMLGAVLAEYFSRHVSINSFTETALQGEGRGEIHRWVPRWGGRPTL